MGKKVKIKKINGGHFEIDFLRSRTKNTAVVEQKMNSAYLK
jgi:hypothetical protein